MKNNFLKRSIVFVFSLLIIFIFVACGDNTSKLNKNKKLEKMSIVLDWYPNAIHCFLYNAIEKGYFADEGIELEILFPANPNDGISMPAAGKADLGIYYMKDVIKARADENVPVKSIGAILQGNLNVVLAMEDQNIKTPKDLEGKKVGYCGSDLSILTLKEMMKHDGANPDKVEFVDVGFDLMNAMTTKRVNATIDCLKNHEIPFLEKEGFTLNSIEFSDYGIPYYNEMVIIAGDKTISEKKEKIDAFLRAIDKGFKHMKSDKEDSLKILLDNQNAENFPLDPDVEDESYETLMEVMETKDAPFLSQKEEVWENNIKWMQELGFLENNINAKDLIYIP